jgi:uncharacterized oxidoreductase
MLVSVAPFALYRSAVTKNGDDEMARYGADDLRDMCRAAFVAAGFAADKATQIAHLMVESNLVGHDSHGVRHIPIYVGRIRDGLITPEAEPEVIAETANTATLDGHGTLGHIAATQGLQLAIEKARANTVGMVAVRNQEHVGRVGAYPEMAARAGFVGITFCNGQGRGISIAAFGSGEPRMGANPFTAAFPVPGADPILLDISTSGLAINKIRQAKDRAMPLPDGAIVDGAGQPSTDPDDFLERGGAALPLGGLLYGHKGFGLAVIVDLFCGMLGGSGTARHHHDENLNNGTFHIVIDPKAFIDDDAYAAEIAAYTDYIHASPPLPGGKGVQLPGEFERDNRAERAANGVEIEDAVWVKIVETLERLNVPAPKPLGE